MMSRDNSPGESRHTRRGDRGNRRVPFEDLVSDVSVELADGAVSDLNGRIQRCLGRIATYFSAAHAFILQLSSDQTSISLTHFWDSDETSQMGHDVSLSRHLALSNLPWVVNHLVPPEPVIIRTPAGEDGSGMLRQTDERSHDRVELVVPLKQGGVLLGSLWFRLPVDHSPLTEQELIQVNCLATILARVIDYDTEIGEKYLEAIRASEAKYRSIFESFQDIFYRANMDGQIILVSPSVLPKLGYRPDEVIGRQATDFYADDPSIRQILLQRLIENGSVSDFELRMRTKDGRILEVSVSAHLLRDTSGNVDGYEGVLRDISDRKKADAILRSLVKGTAARTGRMFFRALVQSMSEGLGCRYVHVGELISDDGKVRTLAFWNGGKFERNFEYQLSRANCNLISKRIMCVHARVDSTDMSSHPCFVRSGVKSFIGAPLIGSQDNLLGFLMVMDDLQIPDKVIGQAQSLITIAAARASSELERMRADQVLQRTVAELRLTTEKLQSDQVMLTEKNIALKTILEHIEQEREGYRAEICASLEQALTPFVKKLQEGSGRLSSRDLGSLTELVGSIVGQGIDSFKVNYPKLSPRETEICELIMEGHPSKDISDILGISVETIHKHREIIRRKLRIQHLDINLSTYLRSKLR